MGKDPLASFIEAISPLSSIGLDTSSVIYFLDRVEPYYPMMEELFSRIENGRITAIISPIVTAELLVKPLKENRHLEIQAIDSFLEEFPHLHRPPLDHRIAHEAARLRAIEGHGLGDAFILALSLNEGCQAVVGNDRTTASRSKTIPYILLENFLPH